MLINNLNKIVKEDIEYIASQQLQWESFRNKTIFISGATGFLPAYLIYTLLHLNDTLGLNTRVLGLARNKIKAEKKYLNELRRKDFSLIIQDVCEPINIKEKVDFIIHAASQASPKYYGTDPVGTLNANILGTNNLLHFAKKNSVESFLFFSSGEVYGQVKGEHVPTKENEYGYINPLDVRSCYAESKRMAETMCVSWHHQFGIPVKIVRPFHTYGPGMELNDGRVYADFISDILSNRNIKLHSKGNAQRAFCYLSDATAGFFTVLLNGKNATAYNVGNSDAEVSIFELANLLCGLFPEKNLKVEISERKESETYIESPISRNSPDISEIKKLGWVPKTGISEGFSRTIKSYK